MHFQALKHSNVKEVKAFSHMRHSHLLGRAMKTRHFRYGTELKPLAYEPAYDFNFQDSDRSLRRSRSDQLVFTRIPLKKYLTSACHIFLSDVLFLTKPNKFCEPY